MIDPFTSVGYCMAIMIVCFALWSIYDALNRAIKELWRINDRLDRIAKALEEAGKKP